MNNYFILYFQILWCGFTISEEEFITVTDSVIRVWNADSGTPVRSVEWDGHYYSKCAIHPDGVHFAVQGGGDGMEVFWFRVEDLAEVARNTGKKLYGDDLFVNLNSFFKSSTLGPRKPFNPFISVLESSDGSITDIALSEDGNRMLVTECKNMDSDNSIATVWDVTDIASGGFEIHTIRYLHFTLIN